MVIVIIFSYGVLRYIEIFYCFVEKNICIIIIKNNILCFVKKVVLEFIY